MALYTVWQIIFFFFLYSLLGWLSEVSYAALETGELVNRGFLNGPLCPIYGSGMVAILLVLGPWLDNAVVVFFGGMVITTLVELIGGVVLYHVFHTRWWDYTNERFNLGGYICLKFSLAWGLGSVLLVMVFHPFIASLVTRIPAGALRVADVALLLVFAVDLGISFAFAAGLNKRLEQLDEARAAMRKASDAITTIVGSNVITADELLDEQKLQLALAKLEGREDAAEFLAQFSAKRTELLATYRRALDALDRRHFGPGRLLRAFPDLKSRDHSEVIARLQARAAALAASARRKVSQKDAEH